MTFAARAVVAVLVGAAFLAGAGSASASAPGESWTSRTSAADDAWDAVAFGDGVFVAVATGGVGSRLMTSADGISWTAVSNPLSTATWRSVTFGSGRFVAVGYENVAGTIRGRAMTSPDGSVWTAVPVVPDGQWFSVAFGDSTFVAVASQNATDLVMTSPDGTTWTAVPSADDSLPWQEVAYGTPGGVPTFVSVGLGKVMWSTDRGASWTLGAGAGTAADWISVTYGSGVFVAVGDGSSGLAPLRSADGKAWSVGTTTTPTSYWESITHGEGTFVAVGLAGAVMSSPDGDVWTARTPAANNWWTSVTFAGGAFVAVSRDGAGDRVMTSGTFVVVDAPAPVMSEPSLRVVCRDVPVTVGPVTCLVTGGDPGVDILWRALAGGTIAESGVTLDETGAGRFAFVVPPDALGDEVTVELVEWLAPVSLGVAAGPVPSSVPSGGGPVPVWSLVMLALVGGLVLRRMSAAGMRG